MIVSSSYDEVKIMISDFLFAAESSNVVLKEEETLITNQFDTLVNNIFMDFATSVVMTRHFKDGTFYLVVKSGESELMLQIVTDDRICPGKDFRIKLLMDIHKYIAEKECFPEDEFLKLIEAKHDE